MKDYQDISSLREKCPNTEFFWSVFSRIRIEYADLLHKFPYWVRIRENTDQKKLHIWTLFMQCKKYFYFAKNWYFEFIFLALQGFTLTPINVHMSLTLHKNCAVCCGFGHIYRRNPYGKLHFLCRVSKGKFDIWPSP